MFAVATRIVRPAGAVSVAAVAAVAAVAFAVGTTATPACLTHQCDPSCMVVGGGEPHPECVAGPALDGTRMEGDEVVWESSPGSGPWLDFGPMRTLFITYPRPFATAPLRAECDIAADFQRPQDNYVPCGGNLVQFMDATPTGIIVKNPNCAGYEGLRLVVRGLPRVADAGDDGGSPFLDASGE